MPSHPLLAPFSSAVRYRHARSWQRPLLDPVRFCRNQLRKRNWSVGKPGELVQIDSFHVPSFTVVRGEIVSDELICYGVHEERLTEAFIRLLQPGQIAIDIGMHLGYFSHLLAQLVGPHGEVHGFEPTPSTRAIAMQNITQFPNVTVHPFAVWSGAQKLAFYDYGTKWMAFNSYTQARLDGMHVEATLLEVETITLDAFRKDLGKPIAVIKIDAESAERQILEGAVQLLGSDSPVVSLEVGDFGEHQTSRWLVEFLEKAGYAPWEFVKHRFVPHLTQERYRV